MSTVYNGVAGNVSPPSALTITNVTAGATPTITVSSPLPAPIVTTFTVDITGVQGATGVNGQWTATKTGANTFTVPSGAPGAYTTGGSAQPILLQAITLPNDGNVRSAASVNVPFGSLEDQVTFLAAATGATKNQNLFFFGTTGAGDFTTTGSCAGGVGGGTTGDWTGTIASLMPFAFQDGATINVNAGDVVLVTVYGNMESVSPANANFFDTTLWYANYVPPASASPTFTRANVPGAQIGINASATLNACPFTISAAIVMLTTGLFDFKIRFSPKTATTTANDVLLVGGIYASAFVLRSTSMPQ